jgi:DnaK suppressor protein
MQSGLLGRHPDALTSRLPALRAALEQQRRFRREQLAMLDANGGTQECAARAGSTDSRDQEAVQAMREVDGLVADGARRALADIELALVRMDTGRYGHCRSCGARIPLVVLEAIPKTTLCLKCQRGSERSDGQWSPAASRSNRAPARREATRRRWRRRRAVDATAGRATQLSGTQ